MISSAPTTARLRDTEGFVVESAAGDLGWVEEVWLGDGGAPRAVAVLTADGRHGLLLAEDVLGVDRERRWLVARPDPELLELAPPRVTSSGDGAGARLSASWTTTGASLHVTPAHRRLLRSALPAPRRPAAPAAAEPHERELWQAVAILLGSVAVLMALVITLAFVVAKLVTGAAY